MKKFDLEKAKNGAEVCRIDGTPAKILDFDFNGNIIYKYKNDFGRWEAQEVDEEGQAQKDIDDLYMAPKRAYATIYKSGFNGKLYSGALCTTIEELLKEEKDLDLQHRNVTRFCVAKLELLPDDEEGGKR